MQMRYRPRVDTSPTAVPVIHLMVGSFSPSVVLEVARGTGRLAEQGLEVEEVPVPSSPAQFRSLNDGELDVALTSPDNVIAYRFSPRNPLETLLDARIVGGVDRGMGLGLYGRPGVTAANLAGARLGVDVPTSGFALALYALLESVGTSRDDVELVALGSTPKRLTALLEGKCDATMLNAGNELVAEEVGCPRLASVPETLGPYLGTVVAVLGEHRLREAERFLAAISSVAADILEGRLDAEVRSAAVARLQVSEAVADRYLRRLRDPLHGLVRDGEVDRASLGTLVDLRRRFLPQPGPAGGDALEAALDEDSGLVSGLRLR